MHRALTGRFLVRKDGEPPTWQKIGPNEYTFHFRELDRVQYAGLTAETSGRNNLNVHHDPHATGITTHLHVDGRAEATARRGHHLDDTRTGSYVGFAAITDVEDLYPRLVTAVTELLAWFDPYSMPGNSEEDGPVQVEERAKAVLKEALERRSA